MNIKSNHELKFNDKTINTQQNKKSMTRQLTPSKNKNSITRQLTPIEIKFKSE